MLGLAGPTHTELAAELETLYGGCCGEHSHKLSTNNMADMARELAAMVENVWLVKGMPAELDTDVMASYVNKLLGGMQDGYGLALDAVDYTTPDGEMLKALANDVYHFSAAKNYQQLKSLSQALLDGEGKLRTKAQFKEAAYAINNKQVNHWLEAEYDLAVNSSRMAAKWVDATRNKALLPLLEYDAVVDSRITELCYDLNGTRKPVDHPFWDKYYPPNHFGCRSSIRQLSDGPSTPDDKIQYPDKLPKMFETNLAKNGLVFPPGHAYYTGLPAHLADEAIKDLRNE